MAELLPPAIDYYIQAHSRPASQLLEELQAETYRSVPYPMMLSGPVVGRTLKLLVELMQAKRVLELGTYTGYSALWMAEGLSGDGRLITCDTNSRTLAVAEKYFLRSPHGFKIQILAGNALETVPNLGEEFDLIFVDANKDLYPSYYEMVLPKLKVGGLIIFDNCLRNGEVLNPPNARSKIIHEFNVFSTEDPRVENLLLSIRDGLHMVKKL